MREKPKSRVPFWSGCAIGCLLLLGMTIAAGWVGARLIKERYDRWLAQREIAGADFVAKGFRLVSEPILQITEPIHGPTVFVGEIVSITADADSDVAIVALSAELRGKVAGSLFFRGQMLAVYPGAEIGKDLDAHARFIHLLGEVKGKVTGDYQDLKQAPKKFGLPETKPQEQ